MRVMVVGSGGREHALAWKLAQSDNVRKIFIAPGNGGTARIGQNLELAVTEIVPLAEMAHRLNIDIVVIGPELPLALGIVDELTQLGVPAFGPTRLAAQIEASKAFAKEFMARHGIPTARFAIVTQMSELEPAVRRFGLPCVIKADGLAGGKGTFIVQTWDQAQRVGEALMEEKILGEAGKILVVEEFLPGIELSFQVISDGLHVLPLATSQDYKRAYDHDEGPNTGGMGAYSPSVLMTAELHQRIMQEIIKPTIQGMDEEGRTFHGVLYAGLMLTKTGPKVLEFNCRFGDPETQVVLPRMDADLAEVLEAAVRRELHRVEVRWRREACLCVVLASRGYPGSYEKGKEITGIDDAEAEPHVTVFCAGVRREVHTENDHTVEKWWTAGGRVLNVVAMGTTLREARDRAYRAIEKIHFAGMFYRTDIGLRAIELLEKIAAQRGQATDA